MGISYLFDFDGTLVDSMPHYVATMLRILEENRISYPDDIVRIITPLGAGGAARYFIEQLGLNMEVDQVRELMGKYILDAYVHTIPAKPHVIAALKELKQRGASLNVLTASPHVVLDPCLKRLGLWELFDNIWSCEDFDTTKTDPEIYRRAARRLNTTVEKVLFLDDNYHADKAAKTAGMLVCGVYDATSDNDAEEIKSVSDFYISDFTQLLSLNMEA